MGIVPTCHLVRLGGSTAVTFVSLGLPFIGEGLGVGWHTLIEGAVVEALCRRPSGRGGGVAEFQQAPVELLTVNVPHRCCLEDQVFC